MANSKPILTLLVSLLIGGSFLSCSGGGDDAGGDGPGNDACDVLFKIVDGTVCKTQPSAIVRLEIDGSVCTGTLISPNKVLTAAHCIYDLDSDDLVRFPPSAVSVFGSGSSTRLAGAISLRPHPTFVSDIIKASQNDISGFPELVLSGGLADVAIVTLDTPLALPTLPVRVSARPAQGQVIGIFGYGAVDGDNPFVSENLISGLMDVSRAGPDNFGANFEDGGSNTCFGDSGGPALEVSGSKAIIGTTALGSTTDCARGELSLFALLSSPRIASFLRSEAPAASYQ